MLEKVNVLYLLQTDSSFTVGGTLHHPSFSDSNLTAMAVVLEITQSNH